jgi:hypothetical protein
MSGALGAILRAHLFAQLEENMADADTTRRETSVTVLRDLQTALDELLPEDLERWERALVMLMDFQNLLVFTHNEKLDNSLFAIVDELADDVKAKAKRVHITGSEALERE